MFLALTFVLMFLGLFGLFWGGSLIAQGYLYNVPAERLPLRALIAALVMTLFLTGWVALDQRSPDTYNTFFDFSEYDIQEYEEFDAVRKTRVGTEQIVHYEKRAGGRRSEDFLGPNGEPFTRTGADSMVVAIIIKDDDKEYRFDADLDEEGRFKTPVMFREADNDRYMTGEGVGRVFDPKLGRVFVNLLLNLGHFLLWFVLIWLVMEFSWGHAFGFAFVLGLTTMLVILPVLFEQN